jgi:hypothetical protein
MSASRVNAYGTSPNASPLGPVSPAENHSELVGRSERSWSKVDAKTFAPNRNSPVIPKIYSVKHVIVLITDIALETTEIDESSIFDRCIVLSVGRRDQIDVNVRAVRGQRPDTASPPLHLPWFQSLLSAAVKSGQMMC